MQQSFYDYLGALQGRHDEIAPAAMHPFTVSQLNQYLKQAIDADENLHHITLQGELSNFTNHRKTGHFYFTLGDESCTMRVVMFRPKASLVRFVPENGMRLIVTGSVQVFARDGALQFYCDTMQPDGVGSLSLTFEQLKVRLAAEGLFAQERKRALPRYPAKIGVVTAKTGAAFHDIVTTLNRRYPLVRVMLFSALVQGLDAPNSICRAIAAAQRHPHLDLLIVGRGGGSMEDLWAFNDEQVARAIYHSHLPVISAVGHEVDFTIADLVADLRAPTPTAAAELATPDLHQLRETIFQQQKNLASAITRRIQTAADRVTQKKLRLQHLSPAEQLYRAEQALVAGRRRLSVAYQSLFDRKLSNYVKKLSILEALSPLGVLLRGYSVTYAGSELLSSAATISPGDPLTTLLPDGEVDSVVATVQTRPRRTPDKT